MVCFIVGTPAAIYELALIKGVVVIGLWAEWIRLTLAEPSIITTDEDQLLHEAVAWIQRQLDTLS